MPRPRKQPSLKAFQKGFRQKGPISVKDALVLEELELARNEQRIITKIMRHGLPPKKLKVWQQKQADCTVRVFNARQKANRVMEKLFKQRKVA